MKRREVEQQFKALNKLLDERYATQQTAVATALTATALAADKIADGITKLTERISALELRLSSRLDLNQGTLTGKTDSTENRRATYALICAGIAALASVSSVVFVIIHG